MSFIRAKHNLVFKLVLVAFCSFVIACVLPDKAVRGHKVDAFTAIWPYDDLVVEQDLFIRKSELEIEREKEQIRKKAPVFFELDNSERNTKLNALEQLKSMNARLYSKLKPLLDTIYQTGVIELPDVDMSGRSAFVSKAGYAEPIVFYDFYSIRSAVEYLSSKLSDEDLDNFIDYLAINYRISKHNTDLFLNSRFEQISVYKNVIRAGQTLAKQGEPLTNSKRFLINRYFYQLNNSGGSSTLKFLAQWLDYEASVLKGYSKSETIHG